MKRAGHFFAIWAKNKYGGNSDQNRTEAVTQSKSNIIDLFKRLKSSKGDFLFIEIVRGQGQGILMS